MIVSDFKLERAAAGRTIIACTGKPDATADQKSGLNSLRMHSVRAVRNKPVCLMTGQIRGYSEPDRHNKAVKADQLALSANI